MLNLKFSKRASRFLKNCSYKSYNKIIEKIKELQDNPFPRGFVRIEGRKDKILRVRTGDFRILYTIIKINNDLFIVDIDKRPKVYG